VLRELCEIALWTTVIVIALSSMFIGYGEMRKAIGRWFDNNFEFKFIVRKRIKAVRISKWEDKV
jgi:hypothetical protein